MGLFAEMIVAGHRRSQSYAQRLLKDVTPAMFARKAVVNGKVIETNHAAWVYGHLCLYPGRIATALGRPGDVPLLPADWEALFKDGTPCLDDVDAKIYPAMGAVIDAYAKGYEAIASVLLSISDADLSQPTPIERYREFLPLVGGMAMFMMNNHIAIHLGQVSAWRRCMGLGSA
ncbi:MAG: DinB family protein [Phycisphaerales bacterium]|nr:DinB family protein [Phycisphaerales bacterium]